MPLPELIQNRRDEILGRIGSACATFRFIIILKMI